MVKHQQVPGGAAEETSVTDDTLKKYLFSIVWRGPSEISGSHHGQRCHRLGRSSQWR